MDVLSGTSWEDFLRSRLLTPLGMDRSNLSADDLRADPDQTGGYERRQSVMVPGLREARGARRVVTGAPLPRSLAAYADEYQHPGYGTLTITAEGDALKRIFRPKT